MVEFMQPGTTITSEMNFETLKKLHTAIQEKRHGILTSGVLLFHDTSRLHTCFCTRELLEYLNWELFDHPLYSPELAPRDYLLFTYLKNWFRSQHFNNNVELMEGVKIW
jgi:hypothetical protein